MYAKWWLARSQTPRPLPTILNRLQEAWSACATGERIGIFCAQGPRAHSFQLAAMVARHSTPENIVLAARIDADDRPQVAFDAFVDTWGVKYDMSFPKIPSARGWRRESESAHHPSRCWPSSI